LLLKKARQKLLFVYLPARFSFYEKHSKSYFSFLCPQNLAFTKSIVKVFFISLPAKFSFCEKHGKSIFSFLCSHKETKQRNAPAQMPPDR